MTEKELRAQRRMKKRVLTVLSGHVPLTPEGYQLVDVVRAKAGKVNYVYAEKESPR